MNRETHHDDFPAAARLAGARVLIVEDEFLIALQLDAILGANGCQVVDIVSDRSGIETLPEEPNIALVDLNLRDGPSGCTIAEVLSERFGTTIVYVTANPGQIAQPARGAVGIVLKPFSQDAIEQALAHAAAGPPPDPPRDPLALPVFDGRA